jgi:hypothetical protein
MVKVVKRVLTKDTDDSFGAIPKEIYYLKNLYLPDHFKIINQELNYPNSWSEGSRGILYDEKKLFEIQKGTGDEYYDMLAESLNDNYNLIDTLLSIMGYKDMSKPSDYNNRTKVKKPSPWMTGAGYRGYGMPAGKNKKTFDELEQKKSWTDNKYESFIKRGIIKSNEEADFTEMGFKITQNRIIKPIADELRVLGYRNKHETLFGAGQFETPESDIRSMFYGMINNNLYNEEDMGKEMDQFVKSPLLTTSFYKYFNFVQINWRPYNRYVNRYIDDDFESCAIPGIGVNKIKFPKEPFIFMVKEYDTDDIFGENGITRIYLMFGSISEKNYNLNVKKATKGDGYATKHYFYKNKSLKKAGQLLSDRIFVGLEVISQRQSIACNNFFGPIINNISPTSLREIRREYNEEEDTDEDIPTRPLYFKYKIIKLKDISPKIVNWPRNKPVKNINSN